MAFHEINGWAIPTELGGSAINTEFGNRSPAFDGSRRRSLRALKRDLEFKTVRAKEMTSETYRGAILGLGILFHYNGDTYATNGLYASTDSETYHHAAAADGDPSYTCAYTGASWNNFVLEYYYGTGSIGCYLASVNLLDADTRDAEDAPNGYDNYQGATLSADTSNYWQATKSVKCVTDGAGADIEGIVSDTIDPGAGSATKTYVASVYVKGNAGSELITMELRDNTNAVSGSVIDYTLAASKWYRIRCEITIGGAACRSLEIRILEKNADSAITFYCDAWQIEEASIMTGWVDGTRSTGTSLIYAIDNFNQDITFNFWSFGPGWGTASSQVGTLLDSGASPTEGFAVYARNDGTAQNVQAISFTNGTNYVVQATSVWDGTWKMITVVLRRNPETGENEAEIYVDGVSVQTGSFTDVSTNTFDQLIISYATTITYNGILDDWMLVPYAASSAQIAAWYAMGKAMSDLPKVYLTGDCIPEDERTVIGEIKGTKYESFQGDSAVHINATSHNFILREE